MAVHLSIGGKKIGGAKIGVMKLGGDGKISSQGRQQEELQPGSLAKLGGASGGATFTKRASITSAILGVYRYVVALAIERISGANRRRAKQRQMKLVESLALGNRRQLLLIVCDKRRYLVGAGADGVGSILAMEPEGEPEPEPEPVSLDLVAKGTAPVAQQSVRPELVRPELMRRGGRARGWQASPPVASKAGPGLWH